MSNVHYIHQCDENRSSVGEEVAAMDWDFSNLGRLLSELEAQPDQYARACMVKEARRRLDKLVQRAYRAQQIASGLRVLKVT